MREAREARGLYRRYITETGFAPPQQYADLLLFVKMSGAPVICCREAAPNFFGLQIGDLCFVNASEVLRDRQRMRVLAHEWCHWLRRHWQEFPARARMYGVGTTRDREELIAREFERLF